MISVYFGYCSTVSIGHVVTFLTSNSFRFDLTWLKYRWHRCTCGLIALAILCNGHDVTWLSCVHDLTCLSTKSTHRAATKDTTRPTERLQTWLCFVLRIILVWRLYQLTIYTHIEYPTNKKLFIEKKWSISQSFIVFQLILARGILETA